MPLQDKGTGLSKTLAWRFNGPGSHEQPAAMMARVSISLDEGNEPAIASLLKKDIEPRSALCNEVPMKACVRLALFLSAAWLVGLGIYAGLAWSMPWHISAAFIYEVRTDPYNPWSGAAEHRFNWGLFAGVFCAGGVATIWLLTVGIAWVVAGFRPAKSGPSMSIALPPGRGVPLPPRPSQDQPGRGDERGQPHPYEREDDAIRSAENHD